MTPSASGDTPDAREVLREAELRIHALGAAISRRDWNAVEQAHAAIRDEFYRPRSSLSASTAAPDGWREALEPFVSFAKQSVVKGDSGWFWNSYSRDRICDWFGPSDFGLIQHFAASPAVSSASQADTEEAKR